jgi:putative endonuclease
MPHQNYFVYMLANQRNTVLYIGITNSLERRLAEHAERSRFHFTRQCNAEKLVYFEAYPDPRSAIEREKQLKKWSRAKKEALIAQRNPEWRNLLDEMLATKAIGGAR